MNRIVAFFLFCFAAIAAAPSERLVAIQEDGGGSWTTLTAAENGEDGNITGDSGTNEYVILELQETWSVDDSASVSVNGWTTSSTNYILIRTAVAARHDGKRFGSVSTAYRLAVTNTSAISISESYTRVEGLQIRLTNTGSTALYCVIFSAVSTGSSDERVSKTIMLGEASSTGDANGIGNGDADSTLYAYNCIAYKMRDTGTGGFGYTTTAGVTLIYNCTSFDCGTGFNQSAGTVTVINSVSDACNDGFAGTFDAASLNNCSSVNNDQPVVDATNLHNKTITFVGETAGSEDLHLGASDSSGCKDGGQNDPGSGLFSDDIDYVTRSGTWDIGADEYVAATTGGQVIIVISN